MVGGNGGPDDNTAQGGMLIVGTLLGGSGSRGSRIDAEAAASGQLIPTVTAKWAKGTGGPAGDETQNLIAHALTGEGADASEDGTGRGAPLVAYALRAGPGVGQGHNTTYIPGGMGDAPPVAFGHTNGLDVQASQTVTPTLRAGHYVGGGGVAAGAAVRRLTPTECERLQGYPDGWSATSYGREQADAPRYRQLGNSIAVPVFEWVARRLVAES